MNGEKTRLDIFWFRFTDIFIPIAGIILSETEIFILINSCKHTLKVATAIGTVGIGGTRYSDIDGDLITNLGIAKSETDGVGRGRE